MNSLVFSSKLVTRAANTTSKPVFARRNYTPDDWVGNREKGFENSNVRKHDEELLAKLRAEESKKKSTPETTNTAKAPKQQQPVQQQKQEEQRYGGAFVTTGEFLEFKKDIVGRIRDLEDELHSLRVKLNK